VVRLGARDRGEHGPAEGADLLPHDEGGLAADIEFGELPHGEGDRRPDRLPGCGAKAGGTAAGPGQQGAALVGHPQAHSLDRGDALGEGLHRVELDAGEQDRGRCVGRPAVGAGSADVCRDRHDQRMVLLG
jgi:hypothetical protein